VVIELPLSISYILTDEATAALGAWEVVPSICLHLKQEVFVSQYASVQFADGGIPAKVNGLDGSSSSSRPMLAKGAA